MINKKELRKKMIRLRRSIPPEERRQAAEACAARLAQRAVFDKAKILFCYAAYNSELSLAPIIAMAESAGKEVAFPRVTGAEEMEFVLGGSLQRGYQGIPEPVGGQIVVPKPGDLMLLPGLAFSEKGDRLGYGKGFYDRYLGALKSRPACWGVGFSQQLVASLPTQEWDQPLDAVLTPEKIIRCGR